MTRHPLLAGVISLIVPGCGQIYAGRSERGAAILIAVIIVGNLNAIWLSLYGLTAPVAGEPWWCELPRILHDLFAFFGIIFWIWQVLDVYQQAKKERSAAGV
jgi:hypothetical protein